MLDKMYQYIYDAFFKISMDPWVYAFGEDFSFKEYYESRKDVIYVDDVKKSFRSHAEAYDWLHPDAVCNCEECQKDRVERVFIGIKEPASSAIVSEKIWPEYFFATDVDEVFLVTEKFVDLFQKERFTGYTVTLLENSEVTAYDSNSFLAKTPRDKGKVYSFDFQEILYNPYINTGQIYMRCKKCGYDKIRCSSGAVARQCPLCNNYDFETNEFIDNPVAKEIVAPIINYYPKLRMCNYPVYADKWKNNDFIYNRVESRSHLVSGRVAKWIVENNIYPLCLIPYPCYVSDCNKEQRERIESIRYHHPCAIPPIQ